MGYVYPVQNCAVVWSGGRNSLRIDQPWDANADLVRERPDLFGDEPVKVYGRKSSVVENTSARPGSKRRGPGRASKGGGTSDADAGSE